MSLEHDEVIRYMEQFLEERGYKVTCEADIHGFQVDILAEKEAEKYFVECRPDTYLRSHEIHVAIGQIVSEMYEVGPNVHYGLAMPFALSKILKEFGTEGIKALDLHLFVIGTGDVWRGYVVHLDTEGILKFIQSLKENANTHPWISLLGLNKPI